MQKQKHAPTKTTQKPGVEGEGSYEATHHYNEGVKHSIEEGHTEELAQKAKEAIDGPEGEELKRAERAGKKGPKAPRASH